MRFLKHLTPADINQLCREHKVKVEITATIDDGEIVHHLPNGEVVTEVHEQIIFQTSKIIKSWSDLFTTNDKHAMFLTDSNKEELK